MPSSSTKQTPSSTSFTVFSEIDNFVSKPVLGSDGAASWQEFRNHSNSNSNSNHHQHHHTSTKAKPKVGTQSRGTAPHLPLKHSDRKSGTTLGILHERLHEQHIRTEAGHTNLHSGYVAFQTNGKVEEQRRLEEKKRKMVVERIRPENSVYFIKTDSGTFEGWKEDYVFTTKEGRGTGYYWDGMDSLKRLLGQPVEKNHSDGVDGDGGTKRTTTTTKKKKKKKKKNKNDQPSKKAKHQHEPTNTIEPPSNPHHNNPILPPTDPNHPMEQVQNALRRRNEILSNPSSSYVHFHHSATPNHHNHTGVTTETEIEQQQRCAEMAALTDIQHTPTNTTTSGGVRSNTAEEVWEQATDPISGRTYSFHRSTGERKWNDGDGVVVLKEGWSKAMDSKTSREYYYCVKSGETSWDVPK